MKFGKPTLDRVLQYIASTYASKPAIIFEDEQISYNELYIRSLRLAHRLRDLGIGRRTKVAILLPNCLEYMYVYFALFMLGAWAVPLSTRYEPAELRNILGDADAAAIVYKDKVGAFDYDLILRELEGELPLLKTFIRLGRDRRTGVHMLADLLGDDKPVGDLGFHQVEAGDRPDPGFADDARVSDVDPGKEIITDVDPDDVALLAYTSGTTGSPKGVMIPHKNLVLTSYHTALLWEVGDEVAFSVAPLYAAQGFLAVLIDLVAGVTMKWISNFNPNTILAHLARQGVTAFHTQPTMWTLLLGLSAFRHVNLDRLNKVVVSGSLCSSALAERISKGTGALLLNAYGLIEATGVVTITRPGDPEDVRLNTVGSPLPGVELKIVDQNRREVAAGETGELAVRGYLMQGYYKHPEQTAEVMDEQGWLYTGDLACYHGDGKNIRIVGRCKDMVIRGGFNVYPIDIEECLLTFDKIEDVSVVGREDDILGECLVAFVIPRADAELTAGRVKAYCRGRIANYKIPDEVYFVSQFPILLSGKVQKNVLAQWAREGIPEENRLLFSGMAMDTPGAS
jgi:fatty-acyl-CoA synthase